MPTGGGKSITFQVPALSMEGICLVITPLIALMKDQVDNLKRLGIKATAVYSGLSRDEIIVQLENCIFGDYKFLYISPERLNSDVFRAKLQAMKVSMLVVDESHCISQWGYDFRPSYLNIASVRELLPGVPVLALTATATPDVVVDIQERLNFKVHNVFQKSFARNNLSYIVRNSDDKLNTLIYILSRVEGCSIVYVRNRKKTREIALALQEKGISADFYHAGLAHDEKMLKQNRWKNNECRVIVSTNAFGMGIDKPDVRLVVHMDMPSSLEEYYQEAGRAGRDEQKAYAVAICSNIDKTKLKDRLANEFPPKDFIKTVYEALGNYYQIAVGFGLNTIHDFSLIDFCKPYKFPLIETHHALKILELSGYIEYTEEQDNASRLMFTASREDLYRFLKQEATIDEIVQVILRAYTGLFSDYVYINETFLSKKTGISQQRIYEVLLALSKYHIVSYIPHKRTPFIIYTQTREEQRYLAIPRSAYEDRLEKMEARIGKMLEYMEESSQCRSKLLISYFGEEDAKDCGCCDICLAKHSSGLSTADFNNIRIELLKQRLDSPFTIEEVVERLDYPKEKVIQVIRFLLDNEAEHFKLLENSMLQIV